MRAVSVAAYAGMLHTHTRRASAEIQYDNCNTRRSAIANFAKVIQGLFPEPQRRHQLAVGATYFE
ncbi:hypothetical protein AWC32_11445 [Mycobacterium xenopi]|nr:hypothetical protein AWC32_11445 [Mycobacterium xenopi]